METIDLDAMPWGALVMIVPPEMRFYVRNPCDGCLIEGLRASHYDEDSRRARYARAKAARALRSEINSVRPR
jgi:hypothetical protein